MILSKNASETHSPRLVRLLLVEDDPIDAGLVEKVLSEGRAVDFSVQRVPDLSTAKAVAQAASFDMVILDLNLPDSQGLDTLSQFRSVVGDAVPIVVLGDTDDEGNAETALYGGEAEFLTKLNLDHRIVPRLLYHLLQRQRSESGLRQLIATYPDGMVVVNFDGVVLFANPAASDLFGRPIGDLINQQFGVPVVGDGAIEVEISGQRIAEMRVVKINWLEQTAWLTSLREITQRKKMEDELREAKVEAELSNIAKTHFLTCMSHELRTPLNSIIGFSEMIEHDMLPERHETCREYAGIINSSGKHLLSIVNDVLDVAAVEAGKVVLDCQLLDVNLVIMSSLQMVSRIAREKGIELRYQPLPYMIPLYADYRRLRQILINLLANAIKYTQPDGNVILASRCNQDGTLMLTIEDTGVGIPSADLANLMKPFNRVGDPYTTRSQGTGLGLYITRVMVELHGGSMTITSELKRGTTVTVCFPPDRVLPYRT